MLVVYSFRTFPEIDKLNELFGGVFIFGKLNSDLEEFKKFLISKNATSVLGVADTQDSRIETKAVNKFGKNKKVSKDGKSEYFLDSSSELEKYFRTSNITSSAFCNWTMFKIKEFIDEEKLDVKFYFVHVEAKKLPYLAKCFPG